MTIKKPVLIIGAGIVGLTLANGLKQVGMLQPATSNGHADASRLAYHSKCTSAMNLSHREDKAGPSLFIGLYRTFKKCCLQRFLQPY